MERSPLDEAKKRIKSLNKWKCQKCQRLTHLFNKYLYIHNKSFIEKWVNRHHFFIDEKNLQKFGLRGGFLSVESYCITILSFQNQFLVLELVK